MEHDSIIKNMQNAYDTAQNNLEDIYEINKRVNNVINEIDSRVNSYYMMKTKMYMDFYRSFPQFAKLNNLPIVELGRFIKWKGWKLSPEFGIGIDGHFYLFDENNIWHKYNKDYITFSKNNHECYASYAEKVIIIVSSKIYKIPITESSESYYNTVYDILNQLLNRYMNQVFQYILRKNK